MPRNLTVETHCKKCISNFNVNCVFLVGDYHLWSFTNAERKSVGLGRVINTYQFPIHSDMNIVNVTIGCKSVVSSAKWTKHIGFEDLYMSLTYKRKSTGLNTKPCWTANVMFDIEELQFLMRHFVSCYSNKTQPALHDTCNAIMQQLTHQYVMINCVECFWEI